MSEGFELNAGTLMLQSDIVECVLIQYVRHSSRRDGNRATATAKPCFASRGAEGD